MLDLTFLETSEIFGPKALKIFEKYGTKCAISDFAILLGGYVASQIFTNEGTDLKDRAGWWWTKTPYDNDVYAVSLNGNSDWNDSNYRDNGIRPSLPYSSISRECSKEVINSCNVVEVTFGEYPQTIAGQDISLELEEAYNNKSLKATGKTYTTDSVGLYEHDTNFKAQGHTEYEYKGCKYIRFVANSRCEVKILSDGTKVQAGTAYWIKVAPITWLVDKKANIAITKKSILSGIQFNNERNYKGKFKKTDIKRFMNKYLSKEIIPQKPVLKYKDKFKFKLFNHGQKLESTLDITNIKDKEINELLIAINKLITLMSDEDQSAIKARITNLLDDFKKDVESFDPDNNMLIMGDPNISRLILINNLARIKQALYHEENINSMLQKIDEYRKLIDSKIILPKQLDSIEDKIKVILIIANVNDNSSIKDELNAIFDNITSKLSNRIKNNVLGISFYISETIDINALLTSEIDKLLIKCAHFSMVSAKVNDCLKNIITIINGLDDKNKELFNLKVKELKAKYGYGTMLNDDLERQIFKDSETLINSLMPIYSRSSYFAKLLNTIDNILDSKETNNSILPSIVNTINDLLNNQVISENRKVIFQNKVKNILLEAKELILSGNIDAIIKEERDYNPNYANLEDYNIIELRIARLLSNLIIEINDYKIKKNNYLKLRKSF